MPRIVQLSRRGALVGVAGLCAALLGLGMVGAPAQARKAGGFEFKLPPAGGMTVATEVLLAKSRRTRAGLPKTLRLKISNRQRMPPGLTIVAAAWLAKPLVDGHPAYSVVMVIFHPARGSARAHAAGPPGPSGEQVPFAGFLPSGRMRVAFDDRVFTTHGEQLALDIVGHYAVSSWHSTPVAAPPPPPICTEVTTQAPDEFVPVQADSASRVPEVLARDLRARAASALGPRQLLSDAALAMCHPPAPAAFYNFMHVPVPTKAINPSCSGFSAAVPTASTGGVPVSFTCQYGTNDGSHIYGQGWTETLTGTTPGAFPQPGGRWTSGSGVNEGICNPSASDPHSAVCTESIANGSGGFVDGGNTVQWQVAADQAGTMLVSPCGLAVKATLTIAPPKGTSIVIGPEMLTVKC